MLQSEATQKWTECTLISPNWISQHSLLVRSVKSTVPAMSPRGIAEYKIPA